jgi:hypothetical protein
VGRQRRQLTDRRSPSVRARERVSTWNPSGRVTRDEVDDDRAPLRRGLGTQRNARRIVGDPRPELEAPGDHALVAHRRRLRRREVLVPGVPRIDFEPRAADSRDEIEALAGLRVPASNPADRGVHVVARVTGRPVVMIVEGVDSPHVPDVGRPAAAGGVGGDSAVVGLSGGVVRGLGFGAATSRRAGSRSRRSG